MPSALRQGEVETNCCIVNCNFFNPESFSEFSMYNEPSLGSGRNMGLRNRRCYMNIASWKKIFDAFKQRTYINASLFSNGTLTAASEKNDVIMKHFGKTREVKCNG